jgi:hypothetical protein
MRRSGGLEEVPSANGVELTSFVEQEGKMLNIWGDGLTATRKGIGTYIQRRGTLPGP